MIPTLGRGGAHDASQKEAAPQLRRVLIADEALPVRRVLLDILKKLGTPEKDILVGTDPGEALELFRKGAPTVVFMELIGVHPEDGLEVMHEMLDHDPEVKIVLITSESRDSAEVRAAVRAGVFAIVDKPLRHEKIRNVLAELESELGGIERYR